jgi:Dolichyl-phosphate-mannose-protein mannosyltransferase
VSGTTVRPAAGPSRDDAPATLRDRIAGAPVTAVIVAATVLALGLRIYQLARPGHLLAVGDVDDGADFGSAIWLVHGIVPYRDFVVVQPPGVTLLMSPAALLSLLTGSTEWALGVGRILTALAGAAAVPLGGLLVRHRGVLAATVTCGIIAIYPGSVQSAHTVLLEPWLVAFCLAGALAVFDGDQLASGRRLLFGGAAFGFAGAIKVWAIIPVAVICVLCLPAVRKAARYLAGVAAGFCIPVLPFAVLAPRGFYDSVIVAQLVRTGARTPLDYRLQQLTGLTRWQPGMTVLVIAAVAALVVVAGLLISATTVTRYPPSALEWFAVVTAALVVIAFLVPDDFYYHYPGFLAPFLAMAVALPAARLIDGAGPQDRRRGSLPPARLRGGAAILAGLVIVVLPLAVPRAENSPSPAYQRPVAAIERAIPAGACVLSDQVSLLISANRLVSAVPGCPLVVDGTGTSYALAHGQSALTSGNVPAVAAVWRRAFSAAQYVCLTPYNRLRIAWTPRLEAYLHSHFTLASGPWSPLQVYVRNGRRLRG